MAQLSNPTNRFSWTRWSSLGWKSRHLLILIIATAAVFAFLETRAQWSPMHKWNRAVGDTSLVLIAFSMAIGPLSRLLPKLRNLLPFRRELGIYGVILAIIHTVIILAGWIEWDWIKILGFQLHPSGVYVMLLHGFGLANVIGIVALVYGLMLALSSSNWSQRILGGSVWKFLQQSSYVLWMLIVIHTAYFLFLHFLDYHRRVPEPNWAQTPFLILVLLVLGLQTAAFLKTWKSRRSRAPTGETAQVQQPG